MPALPPITTTVCPRSSGSRWLGETVRAVFMISNGRPLLTDPFHVERGILGCLSGSPALLARDDVGGVPP